MRTYLHYIGTGADGSLKEILIEKDELQGDGGGYQAEDYFRSGTTKIELQGTVKMSGDAEHMLSSLYVEGN